MINHILISILFLFTPLNSSVKVDPAEKLTVIKVNYIVEDRFLDKSFKRMSAYFRIAYFKDYTLYQIGSIGLVSKAFRNSKNEIEMRSWPKKDTTFTYYVVRNNERFGLRYDSLSVIKSKPFLLDSFLIAEGTDSIAFKKSDLDFGKPVEVIKNEQTGKMMQQKYFILKRANEPDSLYRFYDEHLSHIKFSFFPRLDREHQSKLWKYQYVQLNRPSEMSTMKKPIVRSDFIWEMRVENVPYSNGLIELFKRFEREKKIDD